MRYTISLTLATLLQATAATAEVPRVVTDIPPVHSLVAMVMGDLGQPELLVDKGADSHSFQLRPSQADSLQNAQLIVWIGPEMTPWLLRALDGLETTARQITLLQASETATRSYDTDRAKDGAAPEDHEGHDDHAGHDDGAAADAASDDHDDDHDHGHDHGGDLTDPHAWLDPANATAWLSLIAAELALLDPSNATSYAANAAAGAARIAATRAEITALLAPVRAKPFVVYHDAYGYFTAHFGLNIAGEIAIGDATSPSAARLAQLRAKLVEGAADCIFPEANHDPKLLSQITDGTPTAIGNPLDPEGASLPPGPGLYPDLLRGLATTVAACLDKA